MIICDSGHGKFSIVDVGKGNSGASSPNLGGNGANEFCFEQDGVLSSKSVMHKLQLDPYPRIPPF